MQTNRILKNAHRQVHNAQTTANTKAMSTLKYILFFTTFWDKAPDLPMGPIIFKHCPVNNCYITSDHQELNYQPMNRASGQPGSPIPAIRHGAPRERPA